MKLASISFGLGIVTFLIYSIQSAYTNARLLSLSVLVCAVSVGITLLVRAVIWIAKKYMPLFLVPMRWHELQTEEFQSIGVAAQVAFISQQIGVLAATFGFGWAVAALLSVTFRRI